MNDNKLFDELFESVLDKAVEKFDNEPNDDFVRDDPVEFSQKHIKKMNRLISADRRRKYAKRYLRLAASCIAVFILVMAVTLMSVSALRIRVLNMIFKSTDIETAIKFEENNEDEKSVTKIDTGDYLIGYIPEGYSLVRQNESDENAKHLLFLNGDSRIRISFYDTDIDSYLKVNTEDAKVEDIKIQGRQGFYSESDKVKILVMKYGENAVFISATLDIDKKTIIKIAENIEK